MNSMADTDSSAEGTSLQRDLEGCSQKNFEIGGGSGN